MVLNVVEDDENDEKKNSSEVVDPQGPRGSGRAISSRFFFFASARPARCLGRCRVHILRKPTLLFHSKQ